MSIRSKGYKGEEYQGGSRYRRGAHEEKRLHQRKGYLQGFIKDLKRALIFSNGNTEHVEDHGHVDLLRDMGVPPKHTGLILFHDPGTHIKNVEHMRHSAISRNSAKYYHWRRHFINEVGVEYLPGIIMTTAYQDPRTVYRILKEFHQRKMVDRKFQLVIDMDFCGSMADGTGGRIVRQTLRQPLPAETIVIITACHRTHVKGDTSDQFQAWDKIEATVKSVRPAAVRLYEDTYRSNPGHHCHTMFMLALRLGELPYRLNHNRRIFSV